MATFETPDQLRQRLRGAGLTLEVIQAAWPEWWSSESIGSPSAEAELRFSLARNLGLSPKALLAQEPARFIWHDKAKFKRLASTAPEQSVLTAFGKAAAMAIASGLDQTAPDVDLSATRVREAILGNEQYVTLKPLLELAWGVGIPVVYLRLFPLEAKRMDAMSVATNRRKVVLLARDTAYTASLAFTLAHELGHIALGHLANGQSVIDEGEPEFIPGDDPEEAAADAYALEVLTGKPDFRVEVGPAPFTATQLAEAARRAAERNRVDPGFIALSAAFATERWEQGYGALKVLDDLSDLPQVDRELAANVNRLAATQLGLDAVSAERARYVRELLGVAT